jgi:hypothetical protein
VAVLLRFRVVGLTLASYDRIAGDIREAERLRKAPGFIAQAVYETSEGVEAIEIWETGKLWKAWDSEFRPEVDRGLAAEHLQLEDAMVNIHNLVLL